jgi:hypothetical protein
MARVRPFCEGCASWQEIKTTSGDARGECRHHAPVLITEDGFARWPITYTDDWCADWRSGDPEDETP